MNTFPLEIIDSQKSIFKGAAEKVTLPSIDGEVTVLADHMPLVTPLTLGEIIYKPENSDPISLSIGKGIVSVDGKTVSVLVEDTKHSDEINEEEALKAKKRAEELLEKGVTDYEKQKALNTIRRSLIDVKIARKVRRKPL